MSDDAPSNDPAPAGGRPDRRAGLRGRSLRLHAAQGTIVNTVFLVLVSTLSFIKGFAVAHFLTRSEYGIWGIIVASLGVLGLLRDVGISDRYIQQDEDDQVLAFQKAFTLEFMVQIVFVAMILVLSPLLAIVYHRSDLLWPSLACAVIPLALAFQVPLWIHYRRMNYFRQRLLQSVEPVTTLVVTLALAIAGAKYWSLIIGIAAGQWLTAIVSVTSSPYPVRFRYDRGTLKSYWSFSLPLLWAAASAIVIAQSSVLIGNAFLGVAGVGAIALASQVSQLSDRVDQIVTGTLYPAICAVRDRKDLLFESFVKSNRLALIWGVPFGVGVALFAEPVVVHVLGDHWRPAVPFLQVFGVVAGLNQLAFNWTAYLKAVGETKAIAVVGATTAVIFLASATGLTAAFGRDGFVISVGLMGVTNVVGRFVVMRGMFSSFRFISHSARAIAPTVPAAALVLAARSVDLGLADGQRALVELTGYLLVVVIATWILERDLLREVFGYLRGRREPTPAAPVPA